MSSSNSSLIRSVPLGKRVIKLRQLMIWIRGNAWVILDLYDIPTVLINFTSHGLVHAENALERPFDE
jgi:hypothetical protein